MAEQSSKKTTQSQIRSTALKHARSIEEKKKLKAQVADLVLDAFDLPSSQEADPAHPTPADVALFQQSLSLFQPSDLDDLIRERNIDNRCGYALCPKPNEKIAGSGEKVWNQKGGKDFKIVSREEMERWCSKACANRIAFVRVQLSSEPAWLREKQNEVRLLDDVGHVDDLSGAAKSLADTNVEEEIAERLRVLSLERGDASMSDVSDQVQLVEKLSTGARSTPPVRGEQSIEGHQTRKARFVSGS